MKDMTNIFLSILLANMVLGQTFLIKTKHKKYLASIKSRRNIRRPAAGTGYGNDYMGDNCNLKQRGAQKQHDVPGCGGVLQMRCEGGCLKIMSALYYCKENPEDNPQHRHQAMKIGRD